MRIVLSGIETNNKGAELMLYAILQEIERRFPQAEVYVPLFAIKQGLEYLHTNVNVKDKPFAKFKRCMAKLHVSGFLRRLHLNYFWLLDAWPVNNVDYFIDASGFTFSDQWYFSEVTIQLWEYQLSRYKQQGTKIIFLPQAFGPIDLSNTKRVLALLDRYADVLMPRENTSKTYLLSTCINVDRIRKFTDFTSLVNGCFPQKYVNLRGGVCIIPNLRMIDKGIITFQDYVNLLVNIANHASNIGRPVYMLNHEGKGDADLCYKCRKKITSQIEVVTGLNALEIKGLIASSYLCISSRFHGVASALNSLVPCLSTSWSHKYVELYSDYGLSDCILNVLNVDDCISKIEEYLSPKVNEHTRKILEKSVPKIKHETEEMWKCVWNL